MRTQLAAFLLSSALLAPAARAQFFQESDLDYWNEQSARQAAKPAPSQSAAGVPQAASSDFEDPTTEAFWREGQYVPPQPVLEAAANPTPANVSKFLRWQRKKMDLLAAFQAEVTRQVSIETPLPAPISRTSPVIGGLAGPAGGVRSGATGLGPQLVGPDSPASASAPAVDWAQVKVLFFYESRCPHCQASVGTVEQLRQRGATVIPVQVDWQQGPPLFPESVPYSKEIAQRQLVESVPLWVATYRGDRASLSGEVSVQSLERSLQVSQVKQQAALNHDVFGG